MSKACRAVQEIWSESTATMPFNGLGNQLDVVVYMAASYGGNYDVLDGDSLDRVWLEEGNKFLDWLSNTSVPNAYDEDMMTDQDDKDEHLAIQRFITEMKAAAPEWRKSIGKHGELRLYVDN